MNLLHTVLYGKSSWVSLPGEAEEQLSSPGLMGSLRMQPGSCPLSLKPFIPEDQLTSQAGIQKNNISAPEVLTKKTSQTVWTEAHAPGSWGSCHALTHLGQRCCSHCGSAVLLPCPLYYRGWKAVILDPLASPAGKL